MDAGRWAEVVPNSAFAAPPAFAAQPSSSSSSSRFYAPPAAASALPSSSASYADLGKQSRLAYATAVATAAASAQQAGAGADASAAVAAASAPAGGKGSKASSSSSSAPAGNSKFVPTSPPPANIRFSWDVPLVARGWAAPTPGASLVPRPDALSRHLSTPISWLAYPQTGDGGALTAAANATGSSLLLSSSRSGESGRGSSSSSSAPAPLPGTPGIVAETAYLEEEPLPFRLRSLPLLSEVLAVGTEASNGQLAHALIHCGLHAGVTSAGGTVTSLSPASSLSGHAPLTAGTLIALALGKGTEKTRRDRSLGVLTQRFIKLFLLDRKVVTLEFAATLILPDEAKQGAGGDDSVGDDDAKGGWLAPWLAGEYDYYDGQIDMLEGYQPGGSSSSSAGSVPSTAIVSTARRYQHNVGGPLSPPPAASLATATIIPLPSQAPAAAVANKVDSSSASCEVSKLKVRRLYDVANVLLALKLIDRVNAAVPPGQATATSSADGSGKGSVGSRKPAFRWRGPAYVPSETGIPLSAWALRKVPLPLLQCLGIAGKHGHPELVAPAVTSDVAAAAMATPPGGHVPGLTFASSLSSHEGGGGGGERRAGGGRGRKRTSAARADSADGGDDDDNEASGGGGGTDVEDEGAAAGGGGGRFTTRYGRVSGRNKATAALLLADFDDADDDDEDAEESPPTVDSSLLGDAFADTVVPAVAGGKRKAKKDEASDSYTPTSFTSASTGPLNLRLRIRLVCPATTPPGPHPLLFMAHLRRTTGQAVALVEDGQRWLTAEVSAAAPAAGTAPSSPVAAAAGAGSRKATEEDPEAAAAAGMLGLSPLPVTSSSVAAAAGGGGVAEGPAAGVKRRRYSSSSSSSSNAAYPSDGTSASSPSGLPPGVVIRAALLPLDTPSPAQQGANGGGDREEADADPQSHVSRDLSAPNNGLDTSIASISSVIVGGSGSNEKVTSSAAAAAELLLPSPEPQQLHMRGSAAVGANGVNLLSGLMPTPGPLAAPFTALRAGHIAALSASAGGGGGGTGPASAIFGARYVSATAAAAAGSGAGTGRARPSAALFTPGPHQYNRHTGGGGSSAADVITSGGGDDMGLTPGLALAAAAAAQGGSSNNTSRSSSSSSSSSLAGISLHLMDTPAAGFGGVSATAGALFGGADGLGFGSLTPALGHLQMIAPPLRPHNQQQHQQLGQQPTAQDAGASSSAEASSSGLTPSVASSSVSASGMGIGLGLPHSLSLTAAVMGRKRMPRTGTDPEGGSSSASGLGPGASSVAMATPESSSSGSTSHGASSTSSASSLSDLLSNLTSPLPSRLSQTSHSHHQQQQSALQASQQLNTSATDASHSVTTPSLSQLTLNTSSSSSNSSSSISGMQQLEAEGASSSAIASSGPLSASVLSPFAMALNFPPTSGSGSYVVGSADGSGAGSIDATAAAVASGVAANSAAVTSPSLYLSQAASPSSASPIALAIGGVSAALGTSVSPSGTAAAVATGASASVDLGNQSAVQGAMQQPANYGSTGLDSRGSIAINKGASGSDSPSAASSSSGPYSLRAKRRKVVRTTEDGGLEMIVAMTSPAAAEQDGEGREAAAVGSASYQPLKSAKASLGTGLGYDLSMSPDLGVQKFLPQSTSEDSQASVTSSGTDGMVTSAAGSQPSSPAKQRTRRAAGADAYAAATSSSSFSSPPRPSRPGPSDIVGSSNNTVSLLVGSDGIRVLLSHFVAGLSPESQRKLCQPLTMRLLQARLKAAAAAQQQQQQGKQPTLSIEASAAPSTPSFSTGDVSSSSSSGGSGSMRPLSPASRDLSDQLVGIMVTAMAHQTQQQTHDDAPGAATVLFPDSSSATEEPPSSSDASNASASNAVGVEALLSLLGETITGAAAAGGASGQPAAAVAVTGKRTRSPVRSSSASNARKTALSSSSSSSGIGTSASGAGQQPVLTSPVSIQFTFRPGSDVTAAGAAKAPSGSSPFYQHLQQLEASRAADADNAASAAAEADNDEEEVDELDIIGATSGGLSSALALAAEVTAPKRRGRPPKLRKPAPPVGAGGAGERVLQLTESPILPSAPSASERKSGLHGILHMIISPVNSNSGGGGSTQGAAAGGASGSNSSSSSSSEKAVRAAASSAATPASASAANTSAIVNVTSDVSHSTLLGEAEGHASFASSSSLSASGAGNLSTADASPSASGLGLSDVSGSGGGRIVIGRVSDIGLLPAIRSSSTAGGGANAASGGSDGSLGSLQLLSPVGVEAAAQQAAGKIVNNNGEAPTIGASGGSCIRRAVE